VKNRKRRGITIAELCVVLAVIAIASTVVATFTVMVNARSAASVSKLNAQSDIKNCQIVLERWMDAMAQEDAYITADETGLYATHIPTPEDVRIYRVHVQNEQLIAPLPDGESLSCNLLAVKEFRFSQLPEETVDRNVLYFCTVVYSVQNPMGKEVTFEDTFTIRPRVGQTVG